MKKEIEFPKGAKSINFDLKNGIATAIYEDKRPVLEIGKWYKNTNYGSGEDAYVLISSDYVNGRSYEAIGFIHGFYYGCVFVGSALLKDWKPADMNEVEMLLKRQAKKKGFKDGVSIISPIGKIPVKLSSIDFKIIQNKYLGSCTGAFSDVVIFDFKTGKWAEIIEEKKPLYVNSYGTEFFEGDHFYRVNKEKLEIRGAFTLKVWENYQYGGDFKKYTEI